MAHIFPLKERLSPLVLIKPSTSSIDTILILHSNQNEKYSELSDYRKKEKHSEYSDSSKRRNIVNFNFS